jgi:hypothetical protein
MATFYTADPATSNAAIIFAYYSYFTIFTNASPITIDTYFTWTTVTI